MVAAQHIDVKPLGALNVPYPYRAMADPLKLKRHYNLLLIIPTARLAPRGGCCFKTVPPFLNPL